MQHLDPSCDLLPCFEYQSVGTLCDEPDGLTCSIDAARRWGKAKQIMSYPSFEEAADHVRQGIISAVLVPCAYPRLNFFIMDNGLLVKELFSLKIPPLLLVGVEKDPPASVETLFLHPATFPLVSEIPILFQNHQFVSSNSQACTVLREASASAMAITNGLCASFYNLHIYKALRDGILMPFICFIKNDAQVGSQDKKEGALL